jgi:hypothetical protein
VDAESLHALRDLSGAEHDIPQSVRHRLQGETLAELRSDARRLAEELGIRAKQPRDQAGRYDSIDETIRARAGRGTPRQGRR